MKQLLFCLSVFLIASCFAQSSMNIIPAPAKAEIKEGTFIISPSTKIILAATDVQKSAAFLDNYLSRFYDLRLQLLVASKSTKESKDWQNAIVLNIEPDNTITNDAYQLSIDKDKIYNFPVSFGDADSSDSDYTLSVPGIGYVEGQQHRVNNVDGWGTLTTPFGTFNTLRVVSELTGQDSIYLDTLGFGFSFPRNKTREYKWLATNSGIPELQINTTVLGATEVISSIRYRDIYRDTTTSVGLNAISISDFSANMYPNPSSDGNCFLKIMNASSRNINVHVYSITGSLLMNLDKSLENNSSGIVQLSELSQLSVGMYRISVVAGNNSTQLSWIKK